MSDHEGKKDIDEKTVCANCNVMVEESLMLTCDHNLCLLCGSDNLKREQRKGNHKYHTVICDICGTPTAIDPTSANELLSIGGDEMENSPQSQKNNNNNNYNKRITSQAKSPSYTYNYSSEAPNNRKYGQSPKHYNNNNESIQLNMSNLSRSNLLNTNYSNYGGLMAQPQKKEYCKEHNEEVSYFCFECMNKCICSECVVHGVHKNHDVMNIKKAYPIIIEKSEEMISTVQERVDEINRVNNALENKKKELVDSTNTIKQEMANAFQEIRLKLQKKEKEIMDKTEIFLQEHLQELNTYSRILQSKIIALNKTIDTINSNLMRKDEVNLINFYSDSSNKILHTVETEIPEIPDLNAIYNMKVSINHASFEQMVSNLNGLFLEITSLKGYEINKLNNSYKYSIRRDLYGSTPLNTYSNTGNNVMPVNQVNNSFSSAKNKNNNVNPTNHTIKSQVNLGMSNANDYTKNNLNSSFKSLTNTKEDGTDRYPKMSKI